MMQIEEMSIEAARPDHLRGADRGPSHTDHGVAKVRVTLFASGEDLDRFLTWMRAAQRGESPPALPERTAKALPAGPIDAEFVD